MKTRPRDNGSPSPRQCWQKPRRQIVLRQTGETLADQPVHQPQAGRCPLSRGLVFIDTLHPIFEGRGFRWNDTDTNESDIFEYGSTAEGDAAQNWRRSPFFHMLEHGHEELQIDLADCDQLDFSMIGDLAAKGHKHLVTFAHRFGEAGTMGQMDCVYSYWVTRRDEGFGEQGLAALPRSGPGAGACDQIGSAGRGRPHAGAGLSRARHL